MEDNTTVFWDKKTDMGQIKNILGDELNPRFIEFASLLLSRTNKPKNVFSKYLSKELFVNNWPKIKRKMRENKWNDRRIIFWDEIYRAATKGMNKKRLKGSKERPLDFDPEIKNICDQIKDCRIKSGLTQAGLANKAGLSQQSISFVEQGYVNLSIRTLKKIVDALNLKLVLETKIIS
ncbi:MAG: helix-turn-helix domain-containing protein [Candidatus Omnitrophica bacterium]|nr:helix-turn-helix domain-containing protein [Candidatus Omnitrophota bacterium]